MKVFFCLILALTSAVFCAGGGDNVKYVDVDVGSDLYDPTKIDKSTGSDGGVIYKAKDGYTFFKVKEGEKYVWTKKTLFCNTVTWYPNTDPKLVKLACDASETKLDLFTFTKSGEGGFWNLSVVERVNKPDKKADSFAVPAIIGAILAHSLLFWL